MRPFSYQRVDSVSAAVQAGRIDANGHLDAPVQFLAGGTTLLDLMKLDVMRPQRIVDINPLETSLSDIAVESGDVRLGALARMSDVADHPAIRKDFPVIAQSLKLAASAQLRNMASLGGNVLQRTRCTYFRDVSWASCNKRIPGSGCAALEGVNRKHAVLGTSENCIATYPGDFAQALLALDATVDIAGVQGDRTIAFRDLHVKPGETPHVETTLLPGEIITAFRIAGEPWMKRSLYLKIRDRESYEFAIASAAVALDLQDGIVRQVRIAIGGMATVPWRSEEAEAVLTGKPLDEERARQAAQAAFAAARGRGENAFKPELGRETLVRALLEAATLEF
ncbi:FAD binding domain-containing protein [Microvirga antarctica]|uniref:FAD binding domain-containing protein n=1 Tax=Microvirga antarctica TaxID=2819233 RepID=UPI001B307F7E|nr:xanthine dehydrogenase family protein subunit M [Microvirga antarctica]